MPQERSLYSALLADLSDGDLVEVVGAEIRRRGRIGIMMCTPASGGHCLASVVFPEEWSEMHTMALPSQLAHFAAFASMGRECSRRSLPQADGDGGERIDA